MNKVGVRFGPGYMVRRFARKVVVLVAVVVVVVAVAVAENK